MTRNELQLREKAVVMAYKVGNRNAAANYIMELYHRNVRPMQFTEVGLL